MAILFNCQTLLQLLQRASAKVNFSWNFRCSVKGAVLLVRLWSTLYKAFSKCKFFLFWLFYFVFPLFTKIVCLKVIYSWIFRCPIRRKFYCWSFQLNSSNPCQVKKFKILEYSLFATLIENRKFQNFQLHSLIGSDFMVISKIFPAEFKTKCDLEHFQGTLKSLKT